MVVATKDMLNTSLESDVIFTDGVVTSARNEKGIGDDSMFTDEVMASVKQKQEIDDIRNYYFDIMLPHHFYDVTEDKMESNLVINLQDHN